MKITLSEDLIEIQDVALLDKSQEWTDDVYSLSASVMDGVGNSVSAVHYLYTYVHCFWP
jgi:hypothetical protein